MKSLNLLLSVPPAVFIAAVFAAVLFTFFIYRRTNPIISKSLRLALIALRAAAAVLLLAVCCEAVIRLIYEQQQRPILAVALDHSASMNVEDALGRRSESVAAILKNPLWRDLRQKYELKWFLFADRPRQIAESALDSINFAGDETNISSALAEIAAQSDRRRLSGILLISDGAYTSGGHPMRAAEELHVPIYAVGVGSAEPLPDAAVLQVDSPAFAFLGRPVTLQVSLHTGGLEAFTAQLSLIQEGRVVTEKTITVPPSPADLRTTLEYTPTNLGRQKLEIFLAPHPSEKIIANNKKTVYIDILKSKINILLITGSITPDISFLRRNIDTDRYQVEWIARRSPAGDFYRPFPSDAELDQIDLFILYDFPTRDTVPAAQRLAAALQRRSRPLLLILGENVSPNELSRLGDVIPFDQLERLPQPQQVFAEISPLGITHAAVQLSRNPLDSQRMWTVLPPLSAFWRVRPLSEAEVLVYRKLSTLDASREPLILVRKEETIKSAAITATQLWRWDLYAGGRTDRQAALKPLVNSLLSWLETPQIQDRVAVRIEKTIYSFGETVRAEAIVLDERLMPVDNAEVTASVVGASGAVEQRAESLQEGKYAAEWTDLPPGDYRLLINASLGGRPLGQATTLFSIGTYNAELSQTLAQPEVLQETARVSGGDYTPADSVARLLGSLSPAPITAVITSEKLLWNHPAVLSILLVLLFLEWFIRRRKGMV
ncbi:MAG: hypothetical protein ONB12_11680 [candidate division KSB1 bacterium]|nr:hypothetical protein [candidate division KSB1 bacterium]